MRKSLEEILPGMIVEQNVVVNGLTLVCAGAVLTPEHIKALVKWKVSRVDVEGEDSQGLLWEEGEVPFNQEEFDIQEARVESLFSTVANDRQLLLLKQCVLHAYGELCRAK